jgi:hypothetical protein
MILASKEYVSKIGIGNRDECIRVLFDLHKELEKLVEDKLIQGSLARTYYSVEQIREEDLDPQPLLDAGQGAFPLVWARITFRPDVVDMERLAAIEQTWSLAITDSFQVDYGD